MRKTNQHSYLRRANSIDYELSPSESIPSSTFPAICSCEGSTLTGGGKAIPHSIFGGQLEQSGYCRSYMGERKDYHKRLRHLQWPASSCESYGAVDRHSLTNERSVWTHSVDMATTFRLSSQILIIHPLPLFSTIKAHLRKTGKGGVTLHRSHCTCAHISTLFKRNKINVT